MRPTFLLLAALMLSTTAIRVDADCDLKNAYDFGISLGLGTVIVVTERLSAGSENCSGTLADRYSVGILDECESSGEPTGPTIDANSLTIGAKYTVTWRANDASASCIKLCQCN